MFSDTDPVRGRRIAGLRHLKPMTQEALAIAAGVAVQTVKRAEAGKPLQPETVLGLCSALGATIEELRGAAPSEAVVTSHPAIPRHAWTGWVWTWSPWVVMLVSLGIASSRLADDAAWVRLFTWPAVVASSVLLARLMWSRDGGSALRARPLRLAALGLVVVGVGGPPVLLARDMRAFAIQVGDEADTYEDAKAAVSIRKEQDPSFDDRIALFQVADYWAHVWQAGGSAYFDSPGTYEAWMTALRRCRSDWLESPSYDREKCGFTRGSSLPHRWRAVLATVVGGMIVPRVSDESLSVVRGEDFAQARETARKTREGRLTLAHLAQRSVESGLFLMR